MRQRKYLPKHGIRISCFTNAAMGKSLGVVANVLNGDIIVSHFDLQSFHYVHFRTSVLEKDMNNFIPPTIF